MQFTIFWIYIYLAQYIIGITKEASQRINAVHSNRGISLSVYLYLIIKFSSVFFYLKDRTCLRIAIPIYCFNIFGSIFCVLFCLLIKKLILGCKTIWQSMRKFPYPVWSVSTFPHMDKEETFFSWRLHIGIVWIFQNFLVIFSVDLKI